MIRKDTIRTISTIKSTERIIHALIGAAGQGANLRLTVGAGPDGTIGPDVSQRLLEVGKWLETHGDSIYGTSASGTVSSPALGCLDGQMFESIR